MIDDNLEYLKKLYINKSVPNIIFHGDNLSGKKTLLENFITYIYSKTQH